MGSTCETLKSNSFKKNSNSLLNVKLNRLRDFFASFKTICDNFSIDLSQFQHIFGTGQSSFVIWDTDNNGLIDSLELFAGIAIFSNTKLQDKIRFLFDIFDFNELDFLEPIEIQFMMFCVCSASYKIFSINNEIDNEQIEDFVKDIFYEFTRITVADLIRKSKENKKIQDFLEIIAYDHQNSLELEKKQIQKQKF